MSWWKKTIEKAAEAIPNLSRQNLEGNYRGMIDLYSVAMEKNDELLQNVIDLELQLLKLGMTPCTQKGRAKVVRI